MHISRIHTSLLIAALGLLHSSPARAAWPKHPVATHTFDYVVIGGGPAGLTVANRLTEDASITVAVVEAGVFPEDVYGNITQVPGYDARFYGGTPDIEWGFMTTPQAGMNGASVPYYRAKCLGGSTAINSMAYSQTTKGAFQGWADLVGDQAYTYENMVPYYRKSMHFTPPDLKSRYANATPLYNVAETAQGGLLSVSYPSFAQSWSTWMAKGLAAIGIEPTEAFIDGKLNGSSWQLETISHPDSFRSYAASAYLRPFLHRPNLVVFRNTLAERIIFSNEKVAVGVAVTTNQTAYTLSARKEVILAAGSIQSPQLLQVSGVGPAQLLQQYNIPVVANLSGVGRAMNDHINIALSYRVNVVTESTPQPLAVSQFKENGTGPLSSPGGDYAGFEKIPPALRANFSANTLQVLSQYPADWPEVEYLTVPLQAAPNFTVGDNYATVLAVLAAPVSRGNISIVSARMSDAPLINPNWFTAQSDIDLMIAGFKRVRQMMTSEVMTEVVIGEEFFPGTSVQTDEQIEQYIRGNFRSLSHAFSTCRMGIPSDAHSVLDTHGKVYGVQNLRVVDASAFPFLPPGPSPQAQVYLLAEKLAEDIKCGR